MKTVLMFAYRFPPCSAFPTAAARARGFAAWLGEFGWRPIVVAPELGSVCGYEVGSPHGCEGCQQPGLPDEGDWQLVRVPIRARKLQAGSEKRQDRPNAREAAHTVARKLDSLGRLVRAAAGHLDALTDWPVRAADAGERLVAERHIDAVWATCSPISSLWAADTIARRHRLPWVADIRDSLAAHWDIEHYRDLPSLARTRHILRGASAVVEVTPELADADGRWLGRRCETIMSGFDPGQWRRVTPERVVRSHLEVVYAGKLWPGYLTLAPALAGLRWLRDNDRQARVRLVYYGRSNELVQRDASRLGVQDLVECRGFLAPDELRSRLAAADVLLLATPQAGSSGIPGGKLYEYLGAGRPILAVPGQDGFVAGVLNETGAGTTASSPKEIGRALKRWIDERQQTGEVHRVRQDATVARYSVREGTRRLAGLLDTAIANHRPARPPT